MGMYLLVKAIKLLLLVSLATRMGHEQARQCLCMLAHSAAELQGRGLYVGESCCSSILTADACSLAQVLLPELGSPRSCSKLVKPGERCCRHALPLLWLTAQLCTKTHLHLTLLEGLWHLPRESNAQRLLELQVRAISNHSPQDKIQSTTNKSCMYSGLHDAKCWHVMES